MWKAIKTIFYRNTTETIADGEKALPESVNRFLSRLLKSEDHSLSDSMKWLVLSYSSDLIAAVSRGKVVTLKQFLLGIGRHKITGLKAPIRILSHLGHCMKDNLVCEMETTQEEGAIKHLGNLEIYMPSTDTELTYWWADNFSNLWRHKQDMKESIPHRIKSISESPASCQEQVSQLMFCGD